MRYIMRVTPKEYDWILKLRERCTSDTGFNDAEWCNKLNKMFGCVPYSTYEIRVVQRNSDYDMPFRFEKVG